MRAIRALRPTGTPKMRFLNDAGWVSVWIMYTIEGLKVERRGERDASAGENGGGIGLTVGLAAFSLDFGGILGVLMKDCCRSEYDVAVDVCLT